MEGGIASNNLGSIQDPDLRFEIYLGWLSVRENNPSADPQVFAQRRDISIDDLNLIVREFRSYDPDGSRWGKLQ